MTDRTQVCTTWTVGQVAERYGVTVRTLHHYDEVGLLTASERSPAGYRLYTEVDLERLATIVVYRRLGFGLEDIASLLRRGSDLSAHLHRQRAAVMSRLEELTTLVTAIDRALETTMSNQPATTDDLKDLFGDAFDDAYAQETEERWGDTDAWEQSRARTSTYTRADWRTVRAEADAVNAAFIAARTGGDSADSAAAMDAAEAHRRHIHDRFYDVSYQMHRALADMYVADPRFTKTYDDMAPGLAAYVRDAVHANAARQEG